MKTMPSEFFFPHKISGLIIAGGMSSRYQKDNEPWKEKALEKVSETETLLERTILLLANSCEEILLVVRNSYQKNQYSQVVNSLAEKIKSKIVIIEDNKSYVCTGPTLGILTGLESVKNDYMLVVPVDMPFLSESILYHLVNNLENSSMIVPYWKNSGKIEPLVAAINVKSTLANAKLLSIIRRSRADDIHRLVPKIRFLPINESKLSVAETILASMNEQDMKPNLRISSEIDTDNFFDTEKVFTVSNNSILDDFDIIFTLLKKQMYLKITQKDLGKITIFTDKYDQKKAHFLVGIILYNLLEIIPEDFVGKELIQQSCFQSFEKEANKWNKNRVGFLELHSIIDASGVMKSLANDQIVVELENRITKLKNKMGLKKKNHKKYDMDEMLFRQSPNLLDKAKKIIQKSENEFNKQNSVFESNFLWDHSYRVAKIAYTIALKEGMNPIVPTIAAIFHDAGKFVLGAYHADELPEETHSASIAENILLEEGFSQQEIKNILSAISALYNDKLDCNKSCQIVHDADRLEKLGFLGIANFFTKATLRGKNLTDAVVSNLSRELTYANAAPKTMLTGFGRFLANEKREQSFVYFQGLLDELVFFGIGKYNLKKTKLESGIEFYLVVPEKCFLCEGMYQINFTTERGIKCEKLLAKYTCTKCNNSYEISFCLPIIGKA